MKKLGIVEGFYGSLMSFSQRNAIVESLSNNNLNFYLYAPKEDPFIRKHIDLDHSKEWEDQFQNFCHNANKKNIQISAGLCPKTNDYVSLANKINKFKSLGCNHFAILFDDTEDYDLKSQLDIFNKAENEFQDSEIIFCPSIYTSELIDQNQNTKEYFASFKNDFPQDKTFIWTGPKVISEELNDEADNDLKDMENSNIAVWDNYFTVDSCPELFNYSYFDHLDIQYLKKKEMYFINLTGMAYTDNLIINTFGHFINGKTISFEELLKENKLDKNLIELIHLFNPKNKLKITDSENMKIKKILQEWFSPLKNEWYPYLHYLKKRGEK